jgi:hypothetical protein
MLLQITKFLGYKTKSPKYAFALIAVEHQPPKSEFVELSRFDYPGVVSSAQFAK